MSNKNGKSQQSKQPNKKDDGLTPSERHSIWKDNKVAKASQDDYNVISQKSKDSAEFVNLINFNDQLMYQIRMTAGLKGSRISLETLQKFMDRNNEAKEIFNLLNAELCQALGRNYVPPRGFKHPLKNQQQAAPAKKKATVTKIPVPAPEQPVQTAANNEPLAQQIAVEHEPQAASTAASA